MASCRSGDRRLTIGALVVIVLGAAGSASAQTALAGVIRDPEGYIVPNAPVVIVNEETGRESKTIGAPFGHYIFLDLSPGRYSVRVEVQDIDGRLLKFSDTTVVSEGYVNAFDIHMKFATDVSVTVPGDTTSIESSGAIVTSIDGTTRFTRAAIEAMPMSNGQTLQSMLAVVPGIVFTENTGNAAQFTAGGQQRLSNRLTIDGVSGDLGVGATIGLGLDETIGGALPAYATSGGTQTLLPIAAIDEIEVRTTATAEHARAPGANTSVVTRAGSDRFSARGFSEVRPSQLAANDWFANAGKSPERDTGLWDAGASFGGPLFPGRIFYFGTWERQQIDRVMKATSQVPSLAMRNTAPDDLRRVLDAYPLPNGAELEEGLAEFSDVFDVSSKLSVLSLRLDANFTRRHRLFARFNGGRSKGSTQATGGGLPLLSYSQPERSSTRTATVGWNSTASSWAHEFRANVSVHRGDVVADTAPYGGTQRLPLDLLLPAGTSESEVWTGTVLFAGEGGPVGLGLVKADTQTQVEVADTWTRVHGRHHWRIGFDYRQTTLTSRRPAQRYTYRFAEVAQLLQGRVASLSVEYLVPARARLHRWSAFAQDTLRLSSRLTIDFGLRYSVKPPPVSLTDLEPLLIDFESLPQVIPRPSGSRLWETSWSDIAPHAAVTYQLGTAAGYETNLRAGWSLVFDDGFGPGLRAFGGGPPYYSRRMSQQTAFPVPDSVLAAPPPAPLAAGNLAESYSFPDDWVTPRTYQWQVSVDQPLGGAQRIGLTYAGAAGRELPYWAVSLVDPLRPPTARISVFSEDGRLDYHALLVDFTRRLSRGFHSRVAYSWSHTIDVDSGERGLLGGPPPRRDVISPSANRGSADYDRRHALLATGSYRFSAAGLSPRLRRLFGNWQIDLVGTVTSGAPMNVYTSRSFGTLGSYAVRPDVRPGVPIWIVDAAEPTGRRVNGDAFVVPPEPRQGTLGRNALRASALRQVDLALSRSIRFGPRVSAQLRLDAFNVFNIPNFGPPVTALGVTQFGQTYQSYADALGTGTLVRGGLVPLQQVGGPRSLQVGVRVSY